jgi:hypothetical protein
MLRRNKLQKHVGPCLLEATSSKGPEELAQLKGIFGGGLFSIYEMVQYNRPLLLLLLATLEASEEGTG